MLIVDANIILRYLLLDDELLFESSRKIVEHNEIFIPNEIIAEVVYVLEKVYAVERKDIKDALSKLLEYPNLTFSSKALLIVAFKYFATSRLDFIDSILIGYKQSENYEVMTFDKKLKAKLRSTNS